MRKGSHHAPETREKLRAAQTGKSHTPGTRAKMSADRMGHATSPETRAKLRAALLGHDVAEETRAKIGSASRAISPETRAKMSASQKGNRRVLDAPVKGECVYCFGPATTHDHVIPRGRPGWDDPDNVVLACLPCNAAKWNRTPEEWFADEQAHQ